MRQGAFGGVDPGRERWRGGHRVEGVR
jgi:hypothetical protein